MTIGVARLALPGMLGFDSLALLTDSQIAAFAARGFSWIGTYLEVCTSEYVASAFAHGLSILPICEARIGASLGSDLGASQALLELDRGHKLGIPGGVNVVIDFEDVTVPVDQAIGYIDAIASGLQAGAQPGLLYVAQPQPLSAAQLYARPDVHGYYSGASDNPDIACGYQVFQGLPTNYRPPWALGALVDLDVIFADRRGRLPTLWAPA